MEFWNSCVKTVYEEFDNFKVLYTGNVRKRRCVAVYFSSNGIFFPDTVDVFTETIIKKDRYEWVYNTVERASKHVFLRDVYKLWYLCGINNEINSIEKLKAFITKEIEGYKEVVMVGVSAGGYAATLFGSLLGADIVLGFCSQWNLKEENIEEKILKKFPNATVRSMQNYYDISHVGDNSCVYYFYSTDSDIDIVQHSYVRNAKFVHTIGLVSKNHGLCVPYDTLPYLLNCSKRRLNQLGGVYTGEEFRKSVFSISRRIFLIYRRTKLWLRKLM